MRYLTVLFYQDGRYAGTQGHPGFIPENYHPPMYQNPGDDTEQPFIAHHLGVAESQEGQAMDVSTALMHAIETHPESTGAAPRFNVKDWAAMPQIHDAPTTQREFPTWIRRHGHKRLPKFYKAFLTLHHEELAKAHGIHRGVSIDDLHAFEKSVGVSENRSRVAKIRADQERVRQARRESLFAENRARHHARLMGKGA